jgi:hypothetical protein
MVGPTRYMLVVQHASGCDFSGRHFVAATGFNSPQTVDGNLEIVGPAILATVRAFVAGN